MYLRALPRENFHVILFPFCANYHLYSYFSLEITCWYQNHRTRGLGLDEAFLTGSLVLHFIDENTEAQINSAHVQKDYYFNIHRVHICKRPTTVLGQSVDVTVAKWLVQRPMAQKWLKLWPKSLNSSFSPCTILSSLSPWKNAFSSRHFILKEHLKGVEGNQVKT